MAGIILPKLFFGIGKPNNDASVGTRSTWSTTGYPSTVGTLSRRWAVEGREGVGRDANRGLRKTRAYIESRGCFHDTHNLGHFKHTADVSPTDDPP